MIEQVPFDSSPLAFGTDDLAENPEPRCPCVLILDVSSSMDGEPIRELNEGLMKYKDELAADSLAMKRVEVALVTFGLSVDVACDFTTASGFHPPTLSANGMTPMGQAVHRSIDLLEERKGRYKEHGIDYYRPWLFLITDGAPTDEWRSAAERAAKGDREKTFMFFGVGVGEGANFETLAAFSPSRKPLRLRGTQFRSLFQWLSNSQRSVSRSTPGDALKLEDPTGPRGWAEIVV